MCGCNGGQSTAVAASDSTAPNWTPVLGFAGIIGFIAVIAYVIGSDENKYRASNLRKPETYGGKFVSGDCAHPPCPRKFIPGGK